MRYVVVKFEGYNREYEYKTNLALISGGTYDIVADGITSYSSPITVVGYRRKPVYSGDLREITNAACLSAPPRPDDNIEKIIFNEEKKVTIVLWKDGVKTILKCAEEDAFDKEKAIALAYMKRAFKNRGCFNEVFKKWIDA